MRIHHIHPDTGLYLGSSEADESPMEPGVYLIPANATHIEPPADVAGSARHFLAGGWEYREIPPPEPEPEPTIEDLRRAKRAEIESAYWVTIALVTDGYTQEERDSWTKQYLEARAVLADAGAATPLLSAIAAQRAIAVADLAVLVVEKAELYATIAGAAFGRRRVLLADLDAAQTPDAIDAIAW